jgi:hypothetical protein
MPFPANPRRVENTMPLGLAVEGVHMADKSPKKDATKKVAGKSLKEKRADKHAKSNETAEKARKA